jgi:hypothetical protein
MPFPCIPLKSSHGKIFQTQLLSPDLHYISISGNVNIRTTNLLKKPMKSNIRVKYLYIKGHTASIQTKIKFECICRSPTVPPTLIAIRLATCGFFVCVSSHKFAARLCFLVNPLQYSNGVTKQVETKDRGYTRSNAGYPKRRSSSTPAVARTIP